MGTLLRLENQQLAPVTIKVSTTTAAGQANGSSILDSTLASKVGIAGLYIVTNPLDPINAVARQASSVDAFGEVTMSSVFPAQVGPGVSYALVNLGTGASGVGVTTVAVADAVTNATMNDVIGNKTDTARSVVGTTRSLASYVKWVAQGIVRTLVKGAAAGANYFAGAVAVFTLSPSVVQKLEGVKVDITGFTAGATITCRVYATVNGSALLLQSTITAVVGTGAGQQQSIPIDNSGDTIDGIASSYRVTLQSNNALDTNVAVGYQYVTMPGSM